MLIGTTPLLPAHSLITAPDMRRSLSLRLPLWGVAAAVVWVSLLAEPRAECVPKFKDNIEDLVKVGYYKDGGRISRRKLTIEMNDDLTFAALLTEDCQTFKKMKVSYKVNESERWQKGRVKGRPEYISPTTKTVTIGVQSISFCQVYDIRFQTGQVESPT